MSTCAGWCWAGIEGDSLELFLLNTAGRCYWKRGRWEQRTEAKLKRGEPVNQNIELDDTNVIVRSSLHAAPFTFGDLTHC